MCLQVGQLFLLLLPLPEVNCLSHPLSVHLALFLFWSVLLLLLLLLSFSFSSTCFCSSVPQSAEVSFLKLCSSSLLLSHHFLFFSSLPTFLGLQESIRDSPALLSLLWTVCPRDTSWPPHSVPQKYNFRANFFQTSSPTSAGLPCPLPSINRA